MDLQLRTSEKNCDYEYADMHTYAEQHFFTKLRIVELLYSHTTTQSHWSSGSTVCFPPKGGSSWRPGDAPPLLELGFSYLRCLATLVPPM
jgi:hypothetical protein